MGQNMKSLLSEKRAILFDVDGTLVNSNDLHASAWAEALQSFGYSIPAEQVRPLIGKGGDKLLPELTGIDAESTKGKEIIEARARLFKEHYAPKIKAFPKTKELLACLQEQGKKLAVATSASKDELAAIMKAAELEDCFPLMTSSDDAEASKPDPDILKAALQKAGESADQAVLIGDTPYDIEAASRAGIAIIAFRSGGWSDEDLAGADVIVNGPVEMLAELRNYDSTVAPQPSDLHGEARL